MMTGEKYFRVRVMSTMPELAGLLTRSVTVGIIMMMKQAIITSTAGITIPKPEDF